MSKRLQYRFYALTFPSEFTIEQALDFFDSVSTALSRGSVIRKSEHIVLELWSDATGLKHRIGIPWQHTELLSQLRTHITGVHIEEDKRSVIPDWSQVVEVGVSDGTRPFNIERVESQVRRLLGAAVADLKADDTLLIQWVLTPGDNIKPPSQMGEVMSSHWAVAAVWQGAKADRDEIAERRAKAALNQFRATLRVAAVSSTAAHAKKLVHNVRAAFKVPETASIHFTEQWWLTQAKRRERINRGSGPGLPYNFINALEVATFSTWPIASPQIAGLTVGKTRYLPAAEHIAKDGRRLGVSYQDRPIAISAEDGCRHMYVIGPSGVGKTTLLANSLQQDIERGYGAVVIESKGDLFNAALNAVPRERLDDVVVMNLADADFPVGLNVLQGGNPNRVVDEMTNLLSQGTVNDIYFSDIMYHGLHALCFFPELTITDLVPFLAPSTPVQKAWRDSIINRLPKGSEFYHYWKAFDQLKQTEQRQRVAPVLNRLLKINNRRDIRNFLGQSESTIDLRQIMRDNKLLFIYIPDNIGEKTVSLLTSLLFKELWDAVRDVQKDQPTYLYLDEMQKLRGYINLAEVLSLARSYKFGLVMAHQYRNQLAPETQSAITNAATMISFKLDGPEASWMQNMMGKPVTADDFMSLGPYEAIARVAINGSSSAPTFFKTLAPFQPHGLAAQVINRSREQFSRSAESVDEAILKRRSAPKEAKRIRPSFGDVSKEAE